MYIFYYLLPSTFCYAHLIIFMKFAQHYSFPFILCLYLFHCPLRPSLPPHMRAVHIARAYLVFYFSPFSFIFFLLHGFMLPNIMYFLATSLHSSLRFHAIFNFFFANSLPPSRAALINFIYHIIPTAFIPSPLLTHAIAPVSSLSPSIPTSNSPHQPH